MPRAALPPTSRALAPSQQLRGEFGEAPYGLSFLPEVEAALKAKQQTLPPKLAEAERVVAEEQAQLDAAATRAWARPTFSQSSRGLTRMCLSQSMS